MNEEIEDEDNDENELKKTDSLPTIPFRKNGEFVIDSALQMVWSSKLLEKT